MTKTIIALLIPFVLVYLLFSFVMWEFPLQFSEWDPLLRYVYASLTALLIIPSLLLS